MECSVRIATSSWPRRRSLIDWIICATIVRLWYIFLENGLSGIFIYANEAVLVLRKRIPRLSQPQGIKLNVICVLLVYINQGNLTSNQMIE